MSKIPFRIPNNFLTFDLLTFKHTSTFELLGLSFSTSAAAASGTGKTSSELRTNLDGVINELNHASQLEAQLSETLQSMDNSEFLKTYSADYKDTIQPKIKNVLNRGIDLFSTADPDPVTEEEWKRFIDGIGAGLRDDAKKLTDAMDEIPVSKTRKDVEEIDEEMQNWIPWMFAAGLTACIFLLMIPIILAIGGSLGCCGKRRKRSFGSRRSGGIFMNCGVFSMFLTAWIFWTLAMAAFLFSGLLSQVICEAVRDLENNSTIEKPNPGDGGGTQEYTLPTYASIVQ